MRRTTRKPAPATRASPPMSDRTATSVPVKASELATTGVSADEDDAVAVAASTSGVSAGVLVAVSEPTYAPAVPSSDWAEAAPEKANREAATNANPTSRERRLKRMR